MTSHGNALDRIIKEPWLVGLDKIVWADKEVEVYDPYNSKRLITAIDLLVYTGKVYKYPYHVIEYKASNNAYNKADWQLNEADLYVRRHYGEHAYKMFVWTPEFHHRYIGERPRDLE